MRSIHYFINQAKHLRWKTYQKLENNLHELRYLFWETTRLCNMNCLHCGSDCSVDASQPGLPAKVVYETLKEIAEAYDPSNIILVMTGGEPLVRPDLFEVMAEARKLGFKLGMVTNGYILDKTMAWRLKDAGIISIVVSLDGPETEHDWLRNRKGSYKRVINALEHLVEVQIDLVEAITCVTPKTYDKLPEIYDIVKATGAGYWRVFNIFPIGRAKNNAQVLISKEQFRAVVAAIGKIRKKAKKEGMCVNLSEEGFLGWDYENKVRDTPYFCRAGINIAGIMANGNISACPNLPPWMAQGNVYRDSFVDVWEKRYDIFRDRSWMAKGDCANCKQFDLCQGNSLHVWDEEKQNPAWCHYEIMNSKTE